MRGLVMAAADQAGPSDAAAEPEEPGFAAFTGAGRRLDGKAPTTSPSQPAPRPASMTPPGGGPSGSGPSSSTAAANGTAAAAGGKPKTAGKRMFAGGNRLLASQQSKVQATV